MVSIDSISPTNKKVLVRCDFDVPLTNEGEVAEVFRLEKSLPTIKFLLASQAKVILIAHLGRPGGKVVEKESLAPIARKMTDLLGQEVPLIKEPFSEEATKKFANLSNGEVILLENLRFNPGEEENNYEFAKQLTGLGEIFVNDAFGVCHRKHASVVGVTQFLSSFAGITLVKEVDALTKVLEEPVKPLVAIIGGAKIETKLPAINNLAKVGDSVLVGGKLLMEEISGLPKVTKPIDVVVAKKEGEEYTQVTVKKIGELNQGEIILDIGPATQESFLKLISGAGTIVWNGPMGLFEDDRFAVGTKALAEAVASAHGYSLVGGGETIEVLEKLNLIEKIDHVSTGGGAMLEFLAGNPLPGITALERKIYE